MASIVCPEESYYVPSRTIHHNLLLLHGLRAAIELFGLNTDLVSMDQRKAFDQVNHSFLFLTLEAFGFRTLVISTELL